MREDNYRAISLVKIDQRILTRLLAKFNLAYIKEIIYHDHVALIQELTGSSFENQYKIPH